MSQLCGELVERKNYKVAGSSVRVDPKLVEIGKNLRADHFSREGSLDRKKIA